MVKEISSVHDLLRVAVSDRDKSDACLKQQRASVTIRTDNAHNSSNHGMLFVAQSNYSLVVDVQNQASEMILETFHESAECYWIFQGNPLKTER